MYVPTNVPTVDLERALKMKTVDIFMSFMAYNSR